MELIKSVNVFAVRHGPTGESCDSRPEQNF
jgi:hypothetical protein